MNNKDQRNFNKDHNFNKDNQQYKRQLENNHENNLMNDQMNEPERESDEKTRRKQREKPLVIFGIICIVASIVFLILQPLPKSVDTSQSAKNAYSNKISTAVSAGTVLISNDENIEPKDYTITHKSDAKNSKIWVWDYASEDGDYVQVLVNGTPIGDAFLIKHKPRTLTVPAVGKVQIKGIKDGGGGITYGVRYEINGTSYFNGAPEGEFNTYTLTKE